MDRLVTLLAAPLDLLLRPGYRIIWAYGLMVLFFALFIKFVFFSKQFLAQKSALAMVKTQPRLNAEQQAQQKKNSKRERADCKRFCRRENQESMQLLFYSEQSSFYKYFQDLIEALLQKSDIVIHYITSDPNDVVFAMDNPRIIPYYVGENRLFQLMTLIEADIVVMTLADLENNRVKRSRVRKDVEYIYVNHGCTSLNLTYHAGALDYYDTIFTVNKGQSAEIRQIERLRHMPRKTIVPCGYGMIDSMIAAYAKMTKPKNEQPVILIAPSWQNDNLLDSCLDTLLDGLLGHGFRVIVRPHPHYIRRFPIVMDDIMQRYNNRVADDFSFEMDFSSNETIYSADLIITDWSAIGYEFSFATNKPALYINTEIKAVNPQWQLIEEVPFEIGARKTIGRAVEKSELDGIDQIVRDLLGNQEIYAERIRALKANYLYNVGHSGVVGADYILAQLRKKHSAKYW
ncbi:MAG: CDP-glycerol glycerophosphotransferase family protein [Clostridia bacterium]